MDLFARKKERDRNREEERLRKLQEEEIFKKPEKSYVPSQKTLTLIALILVILVFGYIYTTTKIVLKNDCKLFTGVVCDNLHISATGLNFDVHNIMKEDLNITAKPEGCDSMTQYLRPNTRATFSFNCNNTDPVKKTIDVSYAGYSGLWHDKDGALQGMIG